MTKLTCCYLWTLVEDPRLLLWRQRSLLFTAQQATWGPAWCVGSLCSNSCVDDAESQMDAAHTVGLFAVKWEKEASCPEMVKRDPGFSKEVYITPTLFLLVNTRSQPKMNTFLRIVAIHWPNCLIKYVDQEMVRERGVRNSLELIFKKDFTVTNTRYLKRVGNVECPSNTLIIGPFGTTFCEKRHAIFEL